MIFGNPREFGKEILRGKVFDKGSLIRQSFKSSPMFGSKLLGHGAMWGYPIYEGSNVLTDAGPNKIERLGGVLGGSALGYAAFRPLGLVGSSLLWGAGEDVGKGIGKTVQHYVDKAKGTSEPVAQIPAPRKSNLRKYAPLAIRAGIGMGE
jgi:hypothetical protein